MWHFHCAHLQHWQKGLVALLKCNWENIQKHFISHGQKLFCYCLLKLRSMLFGNHGPSPFERINRMTCDQMREYMDQSHSKEIYYIIVRVLLKHIRKMKNQSLTPFTVSSWKMKSLKIMDYHLEILFIGKDIKDLLQPHQKGSYQLLFTNPCAAKLLIEGIDSWIHTSDFKKPPLKESPKLLVGM